MTALTKVIQLEGCQVHVATGPFDDGTRLRSFCVRYLIREGMMDTRLDECYSAMSTWDLHNSAINVQSCARSVARHLK